MCHLDFVLICFYGVEKQGPTVGKDKSSGACCCVYGRAVRAPICRIVVPSSQRKRLTKWHSFKPQNNWIFSSTSSGRVWNSVCVLLDRYRVLFSRLIKHSLHLIILGIMKFVVGKNDDGRVAVSAYITEVEMWGSYRFLSLWVVTPCSLVDITNV